MGTDLPDRCPGALQFPLNAEVKLYG